MAVATKLSIEDLLERKAGQEAAEAILKAKHHGSPSTPLPTRRDAAYALSRLYPGRQEPHKDPATVPKPKLRLPARLKGLLRPHRYKILYGGRGGAKSHSVARTLVMLGAHLKLRILCARELQVSITDSVHKLLSDVIKADPWLDARYVIQKTSIFCVDTGTGFMFHGIRNNVTKIKSMEGIDIVWVEEAEKVSNRSWEVLIPTMRAGGSEIWITFNPDLKTDPTSKRFLENTPPDSFKAMIGWADNPWFPEELRKEMEYLYLIDPEAAEHVWGGGYRTNSGAQVLRGKFIIESFVPEPTWDGPYKGADFGFSNDPSTLVKCFIDIASNTLYISEEAYAIGVEINEMPAFYEGGVGAVSKRTFPGVSGSKKGSIRADSARPETISYLNNHGFGNVIGAKKGAGSVEDGVAFLRGFARIVIHTRCKHTQEEARLWSYKVDPLSGEPTTDLVDANNHIWDAVRYALEPVMMNMKTGMLNYLKQLTTKE